MDFSFLMAGISRKEDDLLFSQEAERSSLSIPGRTVLFFPRMVEDSVFFSWGGQSPFHQSMFGHSLS